MQFVNISTNHINSQICTNSHFAAIFFRNRLTSSCATYRREKNLQCDSVFYTKCFNYVYFSSLAWVANRAGGLANIRAGDTGDGGEEEEDDDGDGDGDQEDDGGDVEFWIRNFCWPTVLLGGLGSGVVPFFSVVVWFFNYYYIITIL